MKDETKKKFHITLTDNETGETLIDSDTSAIIGAFDLGEGNTGSLYALACNGLVAVFSAVGSWFKKKFTDAKNNAQNAWSKVSTFFSGVWSGIKNVFSSIGSWFKNTFNSAKEKALSAWSNIKSKFANIWNTIKEAFKTGDFSTIGKNLLEGLWNGINDKVTWLKNKVKGVVDKIKSWFTGSDGFDTHSPSKWSEDVMDNVMEGMDVGAEHYRGRGVLNTITGLKDSMNRALTGLNPQMPSITAPATSAAAASNGGLLDKLDRILSAIERGQILTIDGDILVGATADRYDSELGLKRTLAARGAI